VKAGITTAPTLSVVATALILLGAFSCLAWWGEIPERQSLSATQGVVVGIEHRASRYSSSAYLQMKANGQDVRLRILDCESELQHLSGAATVEVLYADNVLYEATQAGTTLCTYAKSRQAAARDIAQRKSFALVAVSIAAFLFGLIAWTRWRIQRHLDRLVTSRGGRDSQGFS